MFSWIIDHWDVLFQVIMGVLTVASLITRFTSTPVDDEIVRKLIAFLSFLKPKDQAAGIGVKMPLTMPKERAEGALHRLDDRR